MKKKTRNWKLLPAAFLILALTGCAENQIPDLTADQEKAVGEYVALTLMRYDAGHRSRLMDLSLYQDELTQPATPEPQEPSGMRPVDDTPVTDNSGPGAGTGQQPAIQYSMEQVIGLPEGIRIVFMGEKFCDYYPDEGELFFSVNATPGKKLMVLSFAVSNTSEQDQTLDLLMSDVQYRVTLNGDYTRRTYSTSLENDLTTYMNTIPAGGAAEAVLIIEVSQEMADSVESISLSVKGGEMEHTSVLR